MSLLTGFYRGNLNYRDADKFHESLREAIARAEKEMPEATPVATLMDDLNVCQRDLINIEASNRIIDDALKQAREVGIDDHLCIAVESARPGLLDPNIRLFATNIPSRTNADKVIVALESASRFGKFAIIAMILGVVLKIISWVINNGGGTDGVDVNVVEFEMKEVKILSERNDSKLDKDVIKNYPPLLIAAAEKAAIAALAESKSNSTQITNIVYATRLVGDAVNKHKGLHRLFVAIGATIGTNPYLSMINAYLEQKSDDAITATIINLFRKTKVLGVFYNPQTIASLYGNKKVKAVIAPSRRMPTVTMLNDVKRVLVDVTSMVPTMRKTLAKPSGENLSDIYSLVGDFVKANLTHRTFEQPTLSNALFETPFTMRMNESEWSEGYHPLGQRIAELAEAGSIGKTALTPIYTELSTLPRDALLEALGVFADTMVSQNGTGGRFADIIKLPTDRAKAQKSIIDAYRKDIDNITNREAAGLLDLFREAGKANMGGVGNKLHKLNGDAAEPLDVLIDHAKTMRSMWETYAALTQSVEAHNVASKLMSALAEVKDK